VTNQTIAPLKQACFILLLILTSHSISAQNSITISGKVTDVETFEPIAYATVAVKNEPFGTITNLAGEFDFHIPEVYQKRIMVISSLGYVDFNIDLDSVTLTSGLSIELEPSKILLDEVLISEYLTAGELLRLAILRIENNFPMSPFEMNGFYRDVKSVNGESVALLEAAVRIYDKNYQEPRNKSQLRERVSLVEVRRTIDYDISLNKYFRQYNMLEDLLLENYVKYRTFEKEEHFYNSLQRRKVPGYNNQAINLVYLEEDDYSLKIFIDEDYGIHRIILILGDGDNPIVVDKKTRKLRCNIMYMTKQIEFQKFSNKLYLKYIASNHTNEWVHKKTGELQLLTERDQALLINQINTTNPKWVKNSKKMKHFGLQYQHNSYNTAFWDNYNTIKEMPLDEKIRADLEKRISLKEQFESFR
jgi:hypothetical protein